MGKLQSEMMQEDSSGASRFLAATSAGFCEFRDAAKVLPGVWHDG
ncbi:hypothetical protein P7L53_04025 [Thermoleptolyngbya sichuanensis XZ-Cy5]|nr:hypothetical protein [Thermoleptolyngbya sichuanensis]MDG2615403.1 hypothetical protein [Thermoleptolyngbya sichuanensis XZ-Cy5]